MNAEYDKGYQSGYDAGYKRAMLDYGLEDDKPCEDVVGVIDELVGHKQEMQNDFGWNITLQEALDAAIKALRLIPDNATNGDVIKALFPTLEWTGACKDVDFYLLDSDAPYSATLNTFRSWLNAPYERGEQK